MRQEEQHEVTSHQASVELLKPIKLRTQTFTDRSICLDRVQALQLLGTRIVEHDSFCMTGILSQSIGPYHQQPDK